MSRGFKFPVAISVLGHAGLGAGLILFAAHIAPLPKPAAPRPIELILAPPPAAMPEPPPIPEPPAVVQAAPEPPPAAMPEPPPPPPPPVAAAEPPPQAAPKPPAHKPPVRSAPPHRPPPVPAAAPHVPPAVPVLAPPPAPPTMQTAALPRMPHAAPPQPAPVVSAGYRSALSAWLESHKRYPESARARGEEGRGVLRFRVERSGRVLNYALVASTGHADLDAAIDQMMRGASLPPFPADMTANDVEVSVTIRFALAR